MSENVPMDWEPHVSHRMGEWRNTVITPPSGTSRFGRIRTCLDCEAEDAIAGGAGSHWRHGELDVPCLALQEPSNA